MAWKSRADKLPPPSYFSTIVAHLQATYKGARISREMMMTLRPFFIEAWRNGRTAEAAAQMTCSCNGHEVVPSPVIGVHIAKGSVRPPKGAVRGDVFGADELRQPAKLERLHHKLERVSQQEQKLQTIESRWGQRVQTSRSDVTRKEAERKQTAALTKRADLLSEAQRIEAELDGLRNELNRARVETPRIAPPRAVPDPQDVSPRSPVVPISKPISGEPGSVQPHKRRGRKPMGQSKTAPVASTPSSTAPEAAPSLDAQSTAMMNAVQGLLPNIASQIAAQMAQGGDKK